MIKPASLRAWITARVPCLASHPDNLHVFVDKGRVVCKAGSTASYEYRYTLSLVVTDYTDSPDALVVPILAWLAVHQPDTFQDPTRLANAIAIEAEILGHDAVDLELRIDLSERVVVLPAGSGWTCDHKDEPQLPDLGGQTGWQLFANGLDVDG